MFDTNGMQGMRNFVWGPLKRGDAVDEFAMRFTRAAAKASDWDVKTGKRVGKAAGDRRFFQDVLNRENVFSEIVASFAAMNLSLRVNDVERVIVGVPSFASTG